jgi:hypothetical protein
LNFRARHPDHLVQGQVHRPPQSESLHLPFDRGQGLVGHEGVDARLLPRAGSALHPKPEEAEALVNVGQSGLGRRIDEPHPTEDHWHLSHDGLSLGAGPLHHDDIVVGVPDQPVGGVPRARQIVPAAAVAAHLLPPMLELPIEHVQGHVHQQGGEDSTLRSAGESPFEPTRLRHHPGLQERPDEPEDPPVANPPLDLGHERPSVHAVETRLDVKLGNPLIGVIAEVDDLGDGVLGPAAGSPTVGGGVEVALKDRLQHQLQGHLHHPVSQGSNPQVADLPALLGDAPLLDRKRLEGSILEGGPNVLQEPLHAVSVLHVVPGDPIHPGGPCALVVPDPAPRHQEGGGVAREVPQIAEPLLFVGRCPLVQLALMVKYPSLGLFRCRPRCADIHRRPPSQPRFCKPAGSLPHVDGFPVPGVLRSLCPVPKPSAGGGPCRPSPLAARKGRGDPGTVPTFTDHRLTGAVPSFTPAASP